MTRAGDPRARFTMAMRPALALLAGLMLAWSLHPVPAAGSAPEPPPNLCHISPEDEEWPDRLEASPLLCGRTTFHASGIAGFPVEVPDITPRPMLPYSGITFSPGPDVTVAFFGFNRPVCWLDREMCFTPYGYYNKAFNENPGISIGVDPPELIPGRYELYVISDGDVSVTFEVEGLTGAMELEATGVVDAKLAELPRNCPATDCEHIGFGGLKHVNGERGAVISLAWSRVPPYIVPGLVPNYLHANGVAACVYPSSFASNTSPEPEDHPYGCDLLPPAEDQNSRLDYIIRTVDFATGWESFALFLTGSGPRYAGYTANNFSVLGGSYGGWGMWITQGIDCPSGDLFDCRSAA